MKTSPPPATRTCWRCLAPYPAYLLPGVRCIKCPYCGALLR